MSAGATQAESVRVPPGTTPSTIRSPGARGPLGLLEGTELIGEFKGSGYHEASWLARRSDGRVVRLAPVLYAVLVALDRQLRVKHANAAAALDRVAEDVRDETGLELTGDHIAYLMDQKLGPLGLTTNSDGSLPAIPKSNTFLALRLKKAVLPSSATWFLGGLFSWLFLPLIVVVVLLGAVAGEIWLFATKPMGSALAETLADPVSALLVGGLAIFSALFHEVGHATACRYGGVRPGPIGFGVYLVYPAFYTDITSSYALDRRGRLRTVLGGVYFNALFIIVLTAGYLWTGHPFLAAAVLISNLELIQQLLPTLRFDGYYIVSDLVGIPDLFKYIGPILRRTLLRQPADERLLALKPRAQRVVTVWVLVVTPVLLAQLTFLAFQVPKFIAIGGQRITEIGADATTTGTNVIGLVGDVGLVLLALLPLAGLLVLSVQAVRGITNIARALRRDADQAPTPGEATTAGNEAGGHAPMVTLMTTGQVVPITPEGRQLKSVTVHRFLFAAVFLLLLADGSYLLSRYGRFGDGPSPTDAAGGTAATQAEIFGLVTFPEPTRKHVASRVVYSWSPPAGGDHAPVAQRCGVYDEPVANEMAVHSMEHGAVWITYRSDLNQSEIDRLRGEARQPHVLLSPYPGLHAPIVATAWGHQLAVDSGSDDRLRQFVSRFRLGPQTPEPQGGC